MQDSQKLICSRCGNQCIRPFRLQTSTFAQCPYVCENCRCKDCSIVLNIDCECGASHAEPSSKNPEICEECAIIRTRVAVLDAEFLQLRNVEIASQESVYGGLPNKREIPKSKLTLT